MEFTCGKCSTGKSKSKESPFIFYIQFLAEIQKNLWRLSTQRTGIFPRYHLYLPLSYKNGLSEHPAMPLLCNGRARSALLGPRPFLGQLRR
jgi:hypothetical protein